VKLLHQPQKKERSKAMDKIKRETLETWLKKHDWFKVNEGGSPDGKQDNYLTPTGEIIIVQYDLEGYVKGIVKITPAPMQAGAMPRFDLRGGGRFPGAQG
jgi:hypothetical protein